MRLQRFAEETRRAGRKRSTTELETLLASLGREEVEQIIVAGMPAHYASFDSQRELRVE